MTREELAAWKKQKRMSVAKLSELSGVPVGTITKILSGETRNPRVDTMRALEAVLGDDHTLGDLYPTDPEENFTTSYYPTPEEAPFLCERAVSYGVPQKTQGDYTFDDLEALPEGRYAELIDGYIYDMATPVYIHQKIAMELFVQIHDYIRKNGGPCEVFVNAFGIFADKDDKTYLIPDLSVVCDPDKIREKGIFGPADLVVEILSPSTANRDLGHKFLKYSQCGTREYWIIDPEKERVTVMRMDGETPNHIGPIRGKLGVGIYEGQLEIDLDLVAEVIRKAKDRF